MTSRLRVAFNGSALLSPLTGIGQYTRSLAEELLATQEVDMEFFYSTGWGKTIRAAPIRNINSIKTIVKQVVPQPYRWSRAFQGWRFSRGVLLRRPELYHEPNFLPYRFDGPTIITAHDLSWIRYPQTHPTDRVQVMNHLFPRALKRAAHVITDAEYVRREIIDDFAIPPERVTSVPLGARSVFHPRDESECTAVLSARSLSYRGYVLCVGTLEPRKNLQLAIRAFAQLPATDRHHRPLVLVGMKGWLTSELESLLKPLITSGDVRMLGFTSDQELAVLYSGAYALVYPSLYEGFGLPPLESMASGTPVIVSNRSTLPEVVGEAGVQVDADDVIALRDALMRLEQDPGWWRSRVDAGLKRASQFSWQRCARETLMIYRRVLASA